MKNHKERLAVETGYCAPSAEIIDICSEGVLCASNKDLTNEDWV